MSDKWVKIKDTINFIDNNIEIRNCSPKFIVNKLNEKDKKITNLQFQLAATQKSLSNIVIELDFKANGLQTTNKETIERIEKTYKKILKQARSEVKRKIMAKRNFERWLEENPLPEFDKNDNSMRAEMQLLNAMAKFNHQQRVAKTPERIEYAKQQFQQNNIPFILKNNLNGHFQCFDYQGNLFQFWCSTGKIYYDKNVEQKRNLKQYCRDWRGIKSLIKLLNGKDKEQL